MIESAESTKGVVALAVLMFGTVAGEYAAIVFCALAGSLWALQSAQTETRTAGALLMLRLVLTAVVLTGPLAWWLEAEYGWPGQRVLALAAFAIGAVGDRWPTLVAAVAPQWLKNLFVRRPA